MNNITLKWHDDKIKCDTSLPRNVLWCRGCVWWQGWGWLLRVLARALGKGSVNKINPRRRLRVLLRAEVQSPLQTSAQFYIC